jgi:hypothetical protein
MARGLIEITCRTHGAVAINRKEVREVTPDLVRGGSRIQTFNSVYLVTEDYEAVMTLLGLRGKDEDDDAA